MKKISSLLLALVLTFAMCFGAMAEAVDYTGTWALTLMTSGETSIDPAALGMDMTITLNADGTCSLITMGVAEDGTWAATETGVNVTDATGATNPLTYADGTLVMELENTQLIFSPAEPVEEGEYASILAGLSLADFNGTWVLEHVETTFGVYGVDELGATMTIVLADGQAKIDMVTADSTLSYEAICETEEAADLGTILWASFIDPATGEPGGSGMMLLLFDDGQLVWYDYDDVEQNEYYYCFDLVTE